MRSSACVVMATKAVAALLRNKMAGVVSLFLLLLLTLPLPFLFGISEVEQIGCDNEPPPTHPPTTTTPQSPPLVARLALSLLLVLSIHPHMGGSRSRCSGDAPLPGSVPTLEQLVESADERGSHRQGRRREGAWGALKSLWSLNKQRDRGANSEGRSLSVSLDIS